MSLIRRLAACALVAAGSVAVFATVAVAAEEAAPAIQVVENPYGLDALWSQGDFIARGTLLVLVLMSVSSWYVLVTKLIEQSRLFRRGKEANEEFWKAGTPAEGVAKLKDGSPFRYLAGAGLAALEHHRDEVVQTIDLNTWLAQSVQRGIEQITSRLQGGLAVLATVGSTAPFIGLFGTVWGIYHALTAIGIAGQASIDKVAGPVGESLIMTAIGLAVAVPAVLGYNWLVRRNKAALELVRYFGSDLHSALLAGKRQRRSFPAAGVARVA
ncbi:MotA/TolQ/ExbB proton channel family protein [Telmatospirillum siberiense]|uniref:Biopolymer transport protein ExbB n=1 Tax=Telmatospirillum siberiense TaxID=382514 RepID=A0A2N3PQ29_9PROT|nr:MotA/TolQ/ExbB proton channel family protein [Telmatospirillum siberiense]PKU22511.1 biopolymer transporter ExbB [Telmatospirillum siberiense]